VASTAPSAFWTTDHPNFICQAGIAWPAPLYSCTQASSAISDTKSDPTDFRKFLGSISRQNDLRRTFDAFVRLAACTLAAQTRESEYLEEAKRWEKPD